MQTAVVRVDLELTVACRVSIYKNMLRACALACFALLTGCNGAASLIRSAITCPSAPPPQVLYPMSGATGVPDGAFTMVVAYPLNPSTLWNPPQFVAAGGSSSISGGSYGAAPNPLPSPIATPGSLGDQKFGVAVPPLQSGTKYSIAFKESGFANCSASSQAGSFTTK